MEFALTVLNMCLSCHILEAKPILELLLACHGRTRITKKTVVSLHGSTPYDTVEGKFGG